MPDRKKYIVNITPFKKVEWFINWPFKYKTLYLQSDDSDSGAKGVNNRVYQAKANNEIYPIRIAKVVNQNIEVEYMQEIPVGSISIIVEYSDETLNAVTPTSIECDTSVLGETTVIIHYYDLIKETTATVINSNR